MRTVRTPFTRRDWDQLPEGFPAQLVAGWLVRDPAPTYGHQQLSLDLRDLLVAVVDKRRVVCAPIDVGIDNLNVFQPDIVVLRTQPPDEVHDVGIPLMAIEILSPSTARRDRNLKRARLLRAGTSEVWLVDPATKSVEVHDANGCRKAEGPTTLRSLAVPGFAVTPATLFGPSRPR